MSTAAAVSPWSSFKVEVIADGRSNGDAYALLEIHASAGTELPPHVASREDGNLVVLEGEVELILPGERMLLREGDHVCLKRSLPRRLRVVADARFLCLVVPAGIERLAALAQEPHPGRDDMAALLTAAGVDLLPTGWGSAPNAT